MTRSTAPHSRTVIAIPVRDEAERIGGCLAAIAAQRGARADTVVLLMNNCSDDTAGVVERACPSLPFEVHAVTCDLIPGEANAGFARALAMDMAADLAGPAGVLLTTDADGRAAPDWLAANVRALRAGADAVAGRAVIDPVEALLIPAALHEDDARECAYAAALDEIASLLDPDPADPWPRHTEESGASLAVTVPWYRKVGGIPRVKLGEDRAFVEALRRHDSRVRHAPEAEVIVSGRIEGRAAGGMADTIRRRLSCPDLFLDDRLEPAADAARRARLRNQARRLFRSGQGRQAAGPIADLLGLGQDHVMMLLGHPHFGTGWAAIEAATPALWRRRVAVAELRHEMRAARLLLEGLRDQGDITPFADQADIRAVAGL